jgi:hypothetical protein
MIKFFRKIRQSVLSENNFSKYLIYAIGEIILVVIGILIALQINNWNENRKTINTQEKYLVLLKKETDANIKELNRVILRVDSTFNAQKYLISNLMTLSERELDSVLQLAIGPQTRINFENSVLSELKTTGQLKNITNDKLRKYLVGLEPYLIAAKEQEDRVIYQCDKAREVIANIGNMASIVYSAGVEINRSFNQEASNLTIQNNSKFKNILAVYLAETEVSMNRDYPKLEKHLNEINTMISKELNNSKE